jgi:L-2-hydroxycarboxylate dehydrogenase (NAD+)
MALEQDMIGIAMTSASLFMVPTFGAKAMLGANPIAVGAPTRNEAPFLYDASTSAVAHNKVVLTEKNGGKVPPGWIGLPDGTPIMEQSEVPEGHVLLPLGGTREIGSHKGYGLAVTVDILCGLLSGDGPRFDNPKKYNHHFLAYNIEAFTDFEGFKDQMDIFMGASGNVPPRPAMIVSYTQVSPNWNPPPTAAPTESPTIRRSSNGIVTWAMNLASNIVSAKHKRKKEE